MQNYFQSITPEQALAQHASQLQSSAAAALEEAAQREHARLLQRGPGRPKKESAAADVLMTAAAARTAAADAEEDQEQPRKRGKYTNWFASSYIHDILAAFQRYSHNARRTVEELQRAFPKLPTEKEARFAHLSESTVRSWHDQNGALLPRFRDVLAAELAAPRRGPGEARAFAAFADEESELQRVLSIMRSKGTVVNIAVIRHVMRAVLSRRQPDLLKQLTLSSGFVSEWARDRMLWTWRARTTAASKLPDDWRLRGVEFAKKIACFMQIYKVPPALVVNIDQTGVHLCPSDHRTYAEKSSKAVAVIGAEDKRQITACITSSLDGDLLPLQLIFQGKTHACHPPRTDSARDAHVHITHSENHWSNVQTMQQWIEEVLLPYIDRKGLPRDSHIVLVLDCWSVHIKGDFPAWLREKHPQIHVVYVPANCTSKLQVADVILQRPFKCGLRRRFNEWAAAMIDEQIDSGDILGLSPYVKMSHIKPLVLQWCIDSWKRMQAENGQDLIKFGWHMSVRSLFDVLHERRRLQAMEEALAAKKLLEEAPKEEDQEQEQEWDEEDTDDEKDELDIMKTRAQPSRALPQREARKRGRVQRFGGGVNPELIDDSELQ